MSRLQIMLTVAVMSLFLAGGLCLTAFFVLSGTRGDFKPQVSVAESTGQGVTVQTVTATVYSQKASQKDQVKPLPDNSSGPQPEKTTEEVAKLKTNVVLVTCGKFLGSGVVFNSDGYILTNYHVISSKNPVFVAFEDPSNNTTSGGKISAKVVKYDEKKDIALLKIDKKLDTFISIGDSDKLKVGEKIVTIGNPEGLVNTVADGIVSSLRKINEETLIQITSPITHGSSGGALLNMQGELVGLTTGGIVGGGNLNFAVSSNDIKKILDSSLLKNAAAPTTAVQSSDKTSAADNVEIAKKAIVGRWIPSYAKSESDSNEVIEFLADGTYTSTGNGGFMVYSGTYSFSSPVKLDFKQDMATIYYKSTNGKDVIKKPDSFSVEIALKGSSFTISATSHFASTQYVKTK